MFRASVIFIALFTHSPGQCWNLAGGCTISGNQNECILRHGRVRCQCIYTSLLFWLASSVAAEGGTGDLTASTAPAQISTPTSDEMVKRRAEPDQDHQQTATKRTHTSLTRTTDDQVLKDANIAAAKIQAGFRGYKVRKQLRNRDSSGSVNGPKRSGTNHRSEGRESRLSTMSLEDESAAKIQAGVRGFLVRRRRQVEKEAATKIQAGFRGFKARRQVNAMKTDK